MTGCAEDLELPIPLAPLGGGNQVFLHKFFVGCQKMKMISIRFSAQVEI